MPGPFVDLKGLVVQMVLVHNMEGYNTEHLFSVVWSRGIYHLLQRRRCLDVWLWCRDSLQYVVQQIFMQKVSHTRELAVTFCGHLTFLEVGNACKGRYIGAWVRRIQAHR